MRKPLNPYPPLARVPSGIPGLDTILSGGFLTGGTYIISGSPGAGKTILGNQIAFHHVGQGHRVVYVTLLAESHARMLSYLSSLEFFNPDPISKTLNYVSGYRTLQTGGLTELLELLRKEVRRNKATLLVLDGLVSAGAVAGSEILFKEFIHELHTFTSMVGCTTFLLTNDTHRMVVRAERTMVDGLIELCDELVGARAVRELVVRKFRGSEHLRGRHAFDINQAGIVVYPRREALMTRAQVAPGEFTGLASFGIARLDEMLHGGLHQGSATLVMGPSGSGKTLLGLSFLKQGAEAGETGLYFGFYESPARLLAKAKTIGLNLDPFVQSGRLEVVWHPPVEWVLDALAEEVLKRVRENGVTRLMIDGLMGFKEAAIRPRRLTRFFAAFTNELRALNVTTLLTEETKVLFGPELDVPIKGLSAMAENLFFLRQVEREAQLQHLISVMKTRDGSHDMTLREFSIGAKGIKINH